MAAHESQAILLAYLTKPRARYLNGVLVQDPLDTADPVSVRFGRSLAEAGRQLQVVAYADVRVQE